MTVTRPAPIAAGTPPPLNGQAPPGRNINVGRVALGIFLVVGLGAAFALTYTAAGNRNAVLAVARPVPAGQAIVAADLKEALVSADPSLHPIPASEQSSVVGKTPAVALVPGTLLSRAQLATGPLVAPGRDVVGLSLKAGQVPLRLRPGDRVIVVRTPANNAGATSEGPAPVIARNAQVLVVEAASPASGGATVASVVVDAADAAAVAAASTSGQASLVVEGGR